MEIKSIFIYIFLLRISRMFAKASINILLYALLEVGYKTAFY
jgi:hypothetical protein